MTEENFPKFLKHFHDHVRCSKEAPVPILLDNHSSHLAIATLDYAKENGIVMLSFPPHCSYKLRLATGCAVVASTSHDLALST